METSEKWKRAEPFLEILGNAVILTIAQMVVLYILLAVSLFDGYNVFLAYRHYFEKYLFVFDKMYFLFVTGMYKVFGGSYLHVPGFNNVFKLVFFSIFLINLVYFAAHRQRSGK